MDPIGLVVGAALLAAGYVAGWFTRPRRPEVRAICACGHSAGAHEDGQCHAEVKRSEWHEGRAQYTSQWVGCACRRYVGPEPLSSEIWVPPVLPERGGH